MRHSLAFTFNFSRYVLLWKLHSSDLFCFLRLFVAVDLTLTYFLLFGYCNSFLLLFSLPFLILSLSLSLIPHAFPTLSHPCFSHTITALRPSVFRHTHHSPLPLTLFIIHTLRQSLFSLHPTLPLLAIYHSLTLFSGPSQSFQ